MNLKSLNFYLECIKSYNPVTETNFSNSLSLGCLPSASFLKCKNSINSLENQAFAREKLKFYPRKKINILAQLSQKFYQIPDLPKTHFEASGIYFEALTKKLITLDVREIGIFRFLIHQIWVCLSIGTKFY